MAPGGVEPPHAGSKPAALSAELRGPCRSIVDAVRRRWRTGFEPATTGTTTVCMAWLRVAGAAGALPRIGQGPGDRIGGQPTASPNRSACWPSARQLRAKSISPRAPSLWSRLGETRAAGAWHAAPHASVPGASLCGGLSERDAPARPRDPDRACGRSRTSFSGHCSHRARPSSVALPKLTVASTHLGRRLPSTEPWPSRNSTSASGRASACAQRASRRGGRERERPLPQAAGGGLRGV